MSATDGARPGDAPRTLVVVPTYNESLTLPGTVGRLRAAAPWADVLVVDDGSPDGTGRLAEEMGEADPAIHVLHRAGKQGLGTAYVAGFGWALERGYEIICEMDADGSHRPEQMPDLLARISADPRVDLVIGSRWVPGGEVENWPMHREVLSRGANLYTRVMLGMPVGDATAGFRAFRAEMLERLDLPSVSSQGYCFQVDMTRRVVEAGGKVAEVPITFVEREAGVSKMSRNIIVEALGKVTVWGVQKRARQVRGLFPGGSKGASAR